MIDKRQQRCRAIMDANATDNIHRNQFLWCLSRIIQMAVPRVQRMSRNNIKIDTEGFNCECNKST